MNSRDFRELTEAQWSRGKFTCVGIDSDLEKIPESYFGERNIGDSLIEFNFDTVCETYECAGFYKVNSAFYEEHGEDGWRALRETFNYINSSDPEIVTIWDAKRADIGNTNNGYAKTAFEELHADAITVHSYLGAESLKPFLDRADKGIFVLCRTSNPKSDEFQTLPVVLEETELYGLMNQGANLHDTAHTYGWSYWESATGNTRFAVPTYQYIAMRVARKWNKNGNCGLVVGATYPKELKIVRLLVGDMPILIPGVGFQQKDIPLETQVEQVITAGQDSRGKGMIINSSRGIIFSDDPRGKTIELNTLVNRYRKEVA